MRIVALDIIRFIAAISVVFYHYISRPESDAYPLIGEVTKYGYLGVPLFFMISGYVIALSANNRTALQFGASRFVRLYPALWASIIFTVSVVFLITDKKYSLGEVLANFTLINEYLGFEDIDGVYWTLKAELKFYACIFLLLLFGVYQKFRIWLSCWMMLTIMHAISGQPFFMGWFITPAYSSFFIAGVVFFLMQTTGKNIFNYMILGMSFLISSYMAYVQASGFISQPSMVDKSISVVIVWGFYCLLYLLCTERLTLKNRKLFVTLGALTYPLYLIHNMAGRAIIDSYSHIIHEEVMIFLVIILMLLVSWGINLAIEKRLALPMKKIIFSVFDKPKDKHEN